MEAKTGPLLQVDEPEIIKRIGVASEQSGEQNYKLLVINYKSVS